MFGTLNKIMLIGRLTRDPEVRTFSNGGKVAAFGFAVSNRKKNSNTGEWEDDPMFIDCKVFNRGENGRQADHIQTYTGKGRMVFLEGHLILEKWETDGQKRSKHVLYVDNFQFLEKTDRPAAPRQETPEQPGHYEGEDDIRPFGIVGPPDTDIPF